MSKFLLALLTLYAAGVVTWLLVQEKKKAGAPAVSTASIRTGDQDADLRTLMAAAREMFRSEIKATLKNIDWRLSRMESLRKSMEESVTTAQNTAEDAAQANYGKLEAMEEDVKRFAEAIDSLEKIHDTLVALEKRVKAVEDRPPQIIKTVIREKGPATPTKKEPEGPKRPTLPVGPKRDPAEVAAEVAKALEDIKSNELDVLFPAIEKIRKNRVMEAVPRLIQIMANHKKPFGRQAAAMALGHMKVADAVPALAEALVDRSEQVAEQANKSIRQVTQFDTELSANAGMRKRRTARNKVKEWWRSHEQEVRDRLGPPKKLPAGG